MLTIGWDKKSKQAFNKYLKDLTAEVEVLVRAEMEDSILKIESEAAQKVPVDLGVLKNSIQSKPFKKGKGILQGGVEVGASYAPYIEFGTGTRVNVPEGLENYARKFKGKGIRKVNISPQPFFYPQVFKEQKELPIRIANTLKKVFK